MSFVEIDIQDQIMIVKLNRPERLNALGKGIREGMADAFNQFKNDKNLEVGILTGEGRGFCAGEDMKESVEAGSIVDTPGNSPDLNDPFLNGTLETIFFFPNSVNTLKKIGSNVLKISSCSTKDISISN